MDFSALLGALKACARPGCETKFIPGEGDRSEFCSDLCVVRNRQQKGRVDSRPNYGTPVAGRASKQPAKKKAQSHRSSALCPHGSKKTFVTSALAWEWIDVNHADDALIKPYYCVCGAIHIGHGYGEGIARFSS